MIVVTDISEWIVEACTFPGTRHVIWMGRADSPEEAIAKAHADGNRFTAYLCRPNYIMTGVDSPVIRERDDGTLEYIYGSYLATRRDP